MATAAPFRDGFRDRRCLTPADGFYQRARSGGAKAPHHFRLTSGEPFAFAGVWDCWRGGGRSVLTRAVVTTRANEVVAPVHARMPAVLLKD